MCRKPVGLGAKRTRTFMPLIELSLKSDGEYRSPSAIGKASIVKSSTLKANSYANTSLYDDAAGGGNLMLHRSLPFVCGNSFHRRPERYALIKSPTMSVCRCDRT